MEEFLGAVLCLCARSNEHSQGRETNVLAEWH